MNSQIKETITTSIEATQICLNSIEANLENERLAYALKSVRLMERSLRTLKSQVLLAYREAKKI